MTECQLCTVPTDNESVCDFCRDYEPPAVSLAQLAAERGVTVAHVIGELVYTGMLFEASTDPRCWQIAPGAFRWHADDCECRFIPGPHPDLVELP
ncbi:MAG: hypothetical protein JST91_08580 [Actinobacteria bacterium]|nr:hypothetical protein [Actinomycetota bacterium]